MFRLNDREMGNKILAKLKGLNQQLSVMHVCGGHQTAIVKNGLEELLLDAGITIKQGPGCPVCVTASRDLREFIEILRTGAKGAVFGDMMRVPVDNTSLFHLKSEGLDITPVYSIDDAIDMARGTKKETVFMAVGFETTAPSTASAILGKPPKNFSVLSSHKTMPEPLEALVTSGEVKLDGLIEPGHVSAIIGTRPYEFLSTKYKIPQVVAGFEPLDILMSSYMLAKQVSDGRCEVENAYSRAVPADGNPKAAAMMEKAFTKSDVEWRGLGIIPDSGLEISDKYSNHNARIKFEKTLTSANLDSRQDDEPKGCQCGEVLRGVITPEKCPLFAKTCTPDNPVGACMVTSEGSCNILFHYGKRKK